jgi:uncharacterized membrane protein
MIVHWRLLLGAVTTAAAWGAAAWLGAPAALAPLIGWNAGALVYIALVGWLFLTEDESDLRARADRLDERQGAILLIGVLAVAAPLGGIVAALMSVKDHPHDVGVTAGLAGLTLVTGWMVLQSLFTAHYAHRHFQAVTRIGPHAGFLFPGEAPRCYLDFVYLAVCIGATAQISDPSVPTTRLRNLVTAHAAVSFFYNTAILAVGINILSSLVGR